MRLLANIIYLIELLAGAPQLAVRRAARAGREAQARQPHHVVHEGLTARMAVAREARLAVALARLPAGEGRVRLAPEGPVAGAAGTATL